MSAPQSSPSDVQAIAALKSGYDRIRAELGKVIVGQDAVIDQLMVCLFANGHVILEGVPGLAKTLMISTLARCLDLSFHRIQFTPDLMPSDITGTEVIQEDKTTGQRAFRFMPGPVFANVILADEINRTPPKTQAALLEAMQERQVTIGAERHPLPAPFFVLATQNPIEQEGTYPLPEAQQDRFMFKVFVEYPSYDEEYRIAETTTVDSASEIHRVFAAEEIIRFQQAVRRIPGRSGGDPPRARPRPHDASPGRGRPRDRQADADLGGGPARGAGAGAGRQSAGGAARSPPCIVRGYSPLRSAGAAPPHRDEFQRQRRGVYAGPGHRGIAGPG